jgi:hypothetical protein
MDDLVVLTLEGEVSLTSWEICFLEVERLFISDSYGRLLIDGTRLTAFHMTSRQCSEVAAGFLGFVDKAAFFSDNKLVFGMMRMIHSWAFNEQFQVFKCRDSAAQFLAERNGNSQPA